MPWSIRQFVWLSNFSCDRSIDSSSLHMYKHNSLAQFSNQDLDFLVYSIHCRTRGGLSELHPLKFQNTDDKLPEVCWQLHKETLYFSCQSTSRNFPTVIPESGLFNLLWSLHPSKNLLYLWTLSIAKNRTQLRTLQFGQEKDMDQVVILIIFFSVIIAIADTVTATVSISGSRKPYYSFPIHGLYHDHLYDSMMGGCATLQP